MKLENIVIRWYDAREDSLHNDCEDCKREYDKATQLLMTAAMELKEAAKKSRKIKRNKNLP